MRNRPKYTLLLCLLSMAFTCAGLTDMDYNLGKSKYGSATISNDESMHGENSALLFVDGEGSYIRISIYPDEPISLERLDRLSMWTIPEAGDGIAQIELFLDGDGDGSYDSRSDDDARLRSLKRSWSEMGMTPLEWNELDAFDLLYEEYGEDSDSLSLDALRSAMGGFEVVRIYITLYKDGSVPTTEAYFDYIKVGDQILSFEPLEQEEIKDGPKSASPGGTVTYVITYGNNLLEPVDLVVTESYDPMTAFIQADPQPDPGTNNKWTIKGLKPGEHGQITVKVRTAKPACKADIKSEVSGRGYTSVRGALSTRFEGYQITNTVTLSSSNFNFTASASTSVRSVEGSFMEFCDHGPGFYSASEQLLYSPSRISVFREVNASGSSIEANISNRPMLFCGDLHARRFYENRAREHLWKESYFGDDLSLNSRAQLSKTLSFFETSSLFSGMADYAFRWNENNVSTGRLAGNFSIDRKATARYYSKRSLAGDDGLGCCFPVQE